jgi:hypothetical protein
LGVRTIYRYRLVDEATGADLGPFVSSRLLFVAGKLVVPGRGQRYVVVRFIESENENLRGYVIVRTAEAES